MTTRRRLLSLAVIGALASAAGCSSSLSGGDPEYDESAVADVPTDDGLAIREHLPAGVGSDRVESNLSRARDLLERVPRPVPEAEVPNEAVRQRLESRREAAAAALERAAEVDASFERLSRNRRARGDAAEAEAEAMYAAAVGDRSLGDELDRAESNQEDLEAVEYGYEGNDAVATLVTVGTVERYLSIADRILESPTGPNDETAIERTAEAAGRVETAAAYVGDARQLTSGLPRRWSSRATSRTASGGPGIARCRPR
jgi:hypothetical protein